MTMALITVRYRLRGAPAHFRSGMGPAATAIGAVPGLLWKIWAFEEAGSAGVSAYAFETIAAAKDFIAGPMIERLRRHSDVAEVSLELASIDRELSERSGAGPALALQPAAVRQLEGAASD